MAYDEGLAQRIRDAVGPRPDIEEKYMFGGIAFLLNGNMSVGITKEGLLVRMAKQDHDAVLQEPHVRPMDFTGRPMRGWVYVDTEDMETNEFERWVQRGLDYAQSLPSKTKG